MTEALRKAIIKKSGPESKCVKNRASENLKKKQRNFCSKLFKKERKNIMKG